jgi:CDP-glycerol glycerophosphotransferase (TagB/SpsB family)
MSDRGLYYDYDKVTPGLKVYDYKSLLRAIHSIDEIDYAKERKRIKEVFLSDQFYLDRIIDI